MFILIMIQSYFRVKGDKSNKSNRCLYVSDLSPFSFHVYIIDKLIHSKIHFFTDKSSTFTTRKL